MKNKTIRFIVEVAISSALFLVLDYIANLYSNPIFVNGGTIGVAMVCIFLMSYRWGLKGGLLTGLIVGLIQTIGAYTIGGAWYIIFIQVALDYWAAYLVVGFSGLYFNKIKNAESKGSRNYYIIISILVGTGLRAVCAIVAGYAFWGSYAPSIAENANVAALLWSFIYNLGYLVPSGILCALVLCIISNKAPQLLDCDAKLNK